MKSLKMIMSASLVLLALCPANTLKSMISTLGPALPLGAIINNSSRDIIFRVHTGDPATTVNHLIEPGFVYMFMKTVYPESHAMNIVVLTPRKAYNWSFRVGELGPIMTYKDGRQVGITKTRGAQAFDISVQSEDSVMIAQSGKASEVAPVKAEPQKPLPAPTAVAPKPVPAIVTPAVIPAPEIPAPPRWRGVPYRVTEINDAIPFVEKLNKKYAGKLAPIVEALSQVKTEPDPVKAYQKMIRAVVLFAENQQAIDNPTERENLRVMLKEIAIDANKEAQAESLRRIEKPVERAL